MKPTIDLADFEKDVKWFVKRYFLVFALGVPLMILLVCIINSYTESKNIVFKTNSLPLLIISFLYIMIRLIPLLVLRLLKTLSLKQQLIDFSIYICEFLFIFVIRYSGGIQSPLIVYYISHMVSISSIMSRTSVLKHAGFIACCMTFMTVSEYTGIVGHIDMFIPPLKLYKNPIYAFSLCLIVIYFMFVAAINAANSVRKSVEREKIRSALQRYLSPSVATEILNNESIVLGGEKRIVTSLFADIREFTKYSEGEEPEDVVSHLNEFFQEMVPIVFRHEGTLDKYMGDALMATFGVLKPHDDDPLRAVRTAFEMKNALTMLNDKWMKEGKQSFRMGIGINTGEAIAGNIGAEERLEYTVIGDSVNTASRLEQLTKDHKVEMIISESTYEKVRSMVEVRHLGPAQLRGKNEPIQIYELLSVK